MDNKKKKSNEEDYSSQKKWIEVKYELFNNITINGIISRKNLRKKEF